MPDVTALQQQAALLEERLAAKQAETDDKTALIELAAQLQQALAEAVAEKRPQAIALASSVGPPASCRPSWAASLPPVSCSVRHGRQGYGPAEPRS